MLKVLQINVEGWRHVDRVRALIAREQPDVACMQEIFEETFEAFKKEFGMEGRFVPTLMHDQDGRGLSPRGEAIFVRGLPAAFGHAWYWNPGESLNEGEDGNRQNETHRGVLHASVEKDGARYSCATTHFPKNSVGAIVSPFQESLRKPLTDILAGLPSLIFTADTNSPRGTAVFDGLAELYADNIPAAVTSTLDPVFHRVKPTLPYVVDCFFTAPDIDVSSIRLEEGVSDHLAIIATVSKR